MMGRFPVCLATERARRDARHQQQEEGEEQEEENGRKTTCTKRGLNVNSHHYNEGEEGDGNENENGNNSNGDDGDATEASHNANKTKRNAHHYANEEEEKEELTDGDEEEAAEQKCYYASGHSGGAVSYSGSRFDVLSRLQKVDHLVGSEDRKASQKKQRSHQQSSFHVSTHTINSSSNSNNNSHRAATQHAAMNKHRDGKGEEKSTPGGSSSSSNPNSTSGGGGELEEEEEADSPPTPTNARERGKATAEERNEGEEEEEGLLSFPYCPRIPSKSRHGRLLPQPFSHILVLDFEATCDAAAIHYPHEIIEFPVVVLDTRTLHVVAEFHRYVRPVRHPTLTSFCTELTGITQEMVDAAAPLPVVLSEFASWLESSIYPLCRAWKEEWARAIAENEEEEEEEEEVISMKASKANHNNNNNNNTNNNNKKPSSAYTAAMRCYYPSATAEVLDQCGLSRHLANEKKKFTISKPHDAQGFSARARAATNATQRDSSSSSSSSSSNSSSTHGGVSFAEEESMICFATDGPWDMRKFMFECEVLLHKNIFPPLFYRFINVRECFTKAFRCRQVKLTHMLRRLQMSFEGRRHSGIDDTRNILRVLAELLARGYRIHHVSTIQYREASSCVLRHEQEAHQLLLDEEFAGGIGGKKKSGGGAAAGIGPQRHNNNTNNNKKKNNNKNNDAQQQNSGKKGKRR